VQISHRTKYKFAEFATAFAVLRQIENGDRQDNSIEECQNNVTLVI
jgi:hypothetical protein